MTFKNIKSDVEKTIHYMKVAMYEDIHVREDDKFKYMSKTMDINFGIALWMEIQKQIREQIEHAK